MGNKKVICIAGKYQVACEALRYLVKSKLFLKENICALLSAEKINIYGMENFKNVTAELGVRVLNDISELYKIENLVFFSLEFDKIINPEKFISKELFNIHFSKLPTYKGVLTSVWPLINGDKKSGVTLHKIDKGIDTGNIIGQIEFPIDITDTCRDLYFKYHKYGLELFRKNIKKVLVKHYIEKTQDVYGSTYYSRESINYSELKVNLKQSAYQVHNQVRAFIFNEYQLPMILGFKISKSELTNQRSVKPAGSLVKETKEYLQVSTRDYDLILAKDK
jgi:methionyl-tRNA formyltransferase